MSDLEERLAALEEVVSELASSSETVSSGDTPNDSTWTCDSCNALLGVYDTKKNVLRRKYKDDVSFTTLGIGGMITVLCRKCACPCVITQDDLKAVKESVVRSGLSK